MPKSNSSFSWQQALAFISKCPLCKVEYDIKKARLCAEQEEKAYLVHLTCQKCHSYFLVMILMIGPNASSVGMITDLSYEDTKRLYYTEAITLNEALNGYKIMKSKYFHTTLLNNK